MSSCKQTQTLPLTLSEKKGVKISSVSLKGVKAEVTVKIKNPNSVDVPVYRSEFAVKLNGMRIGKAKIKKVIIPANSEVEEVLYLKSNFSGLGYSDIPKVFSTVKDSIQIFSLNGNLRSGQYFHKKLNPVELAETINIKKKIKPVSLFISKVIKKNQLKNLFGNSRKEPLGADDQPKTTEENKME
jgi:hypothetical protein